VRALQAIGERPIRQRARLHLHHAAREVLGRIEFLQGEQLGAGQSQLARLHLEAPLMARPGDRIVLRSFSPTHTVAGAVVLDPQPPQRQRREASLDFLRQLERGGAAEWPSAELSRDGLAGATQATCAARWRVVGFDGLGAEAATQAKLQAKAWSICGDRLVARECLDAMATRLLELLRAHQREAPLSPGLAKEQLRQALGIDSPAHFQNLIDAAAAAHPIFARGDRVRADAAEVALDPGLAAAVNRWESKIKGAEPAYSPSRSEMQDAHVRLLIDRGTVVVLDGPLLAHRARLDQLVERVRAHFGRSQTLDIAAVKEWTGASRKFVVPILEWLDREGFTEFDGKLRRQGPKLN
jgi:selenocysteine-specific elongation factor